MSTQIEIKPIAEREEGNLELLCRQIADGKASGSDAFRTLRQASGMSQREAAAVVGRSAVAICDWEAGRGWPTSVEMMPRLLEAFGLPVSMLLRVFGSEFDNRLSARAYLENDPVALEAMWFRSHRGKCLSILTKKAAGGSERHLRLFFDLMHKNSEAVIRNLSINATGTNPKLISERRTWLAQSIGLKNDSTVGENESESSKTGSKNGSTVGSKVGVSPAGNVGGGSPEMDGSGDPNVEGS